jgi:multimeric flavodoxin WrbA
MQAKDTGHETNAKSEFSKKEWRGKKAALTAKGKSQCEVWECCMSLQGFLQQRTSVAVAVAVRNNAQ